MGYNFNLPNRKSLRGWVVFVRADAVLGVDTGSRGSHMTNGYRIGIFITSVS